MRFRAWNRNAATREQWLLPDIAREVRITIQPRQPWANGKPDEQTPRTDAALLSTKQETGWCQSSQKIRALFMPPGNYNRGATMRIQASCRREAGPRRNGLRRFSASENKGGSQQRIKLVASAATLAVPLWLTAAYSG